jgi:hypothetical protein
MTKWVLALTSILFISSANAQTPPPPQVKVCLWNGNAFSEGAYFCVAKDSTITCKDGKWVSGSSDPVCANSPQKAPE